MWIENIIYSNKYMQVQTCQKAKHGKDNGFQAIVCNPLFMCVICAFGACSFGADGIILSLCNWIFTEPKYKENVLAAFNGINKQSWS